MTKIYGVKITKCDGSSEGTKIFTNKKEAKSFAFHWVNDKKYEHRSKCGENDRDYGKLKAIVISANDYGKWINKEFFVAEYY